MKKEYSDVQLNQNNLGQLKRKRKILQIKNLKCSNYGCGKKFYKELNFKQHQKKCQYQGKSYKCDFPSCLKSFPKIGNLRKHKINHYDKKIYVCEFQDCKKIFTALAIYKVTLLNCVSLFNYVYKLYNKTPFFL